MTDQDYLGHLATLAGIEPHYWDIWGNYHGVSAESKRQLLAALGIPADTDKEITSSIADIEDDLWRQPLPPVHIVIEGQPLILCLTLPADRFAVSAIVQIVEEDGVRHEIPIHFLQAAVEAVRVIDGRSLERRRVEVPAHLPLGYHELSIPQLTDGATRLIVAPKRCYLPPALANRGRTWGLVAHLYTLRSPRNWGIGDFTDLGDLAQVAARLGASVIGVNPLHALFPSKPERASPYSPSSRLFLNPIYIDVDAAADFVGSKAAKRPIASLADEVAAVRSGSLIDYTAIARLKYRALQIVFDAFEQNHLKIGRNSDKGREFLEFCDHHGGRLHNFAIFEALSERFEGKSWREWPEAFHVPQSADVVAFAEQNRQRVQFFSFLQWQAELQLAAAQRRAQQEGLAIGLYRDLAVGVAVDGSDAWSEQDVIVQLASVGAPPDPFNMLGQDWGTPPLHPTVLRHLGYDPFIAILRSNMRHAGALRIDHVMALMHLFWIPAGEPPASGGYLTYPFDDLLALVALESQRSGCLVIGEDLGTVPEGFRDRMAAANVLSYRVLYFEKDGDRFKTPSEYPALALACVSTHDLPTLAGFWLGEDIDLKSRLGLYPSAEAENNEREARHHDRFLLLRAMAAEGLLPDGVRPETAHQTTLTPDLAAAVHHYLFRSPACVAMVQLEDIIMEREQLNLPGTVDEHPNWRRKLATDIDGIADAPMVHALRKALSDRRIAPNGSPPTA